MIRQIKIFFSLLKDGLDSAIRGNTTYHIWMGVLTLLMLLGAYSYYIQLTEGLVVTGMSDRVSWGLYISNFTFLVGVAAAAVMIVVPTYVLHDIDFSKAVLIGEGLAVAEEDSLTFYANTFDTDTATPGIQEAYTTATADITTDGLDIQQFVEVILP